MSSIDNLAEKIKAKHPEYQDLDNLQLVQKVVDKYPQYADMLDTGDKTLLGNITSLNGKGPIDDLMGASKDIGTMVKAGGAGIGDIDANLLPKVANMIPGVNMPTMPFLPAVQQAGTDVNNVMSGLAPETTAGNIGQTVGSFFTPNQIALQAVGGAIAQPVADALGTAASSTLSGLNKYVPDIPGIAGKVGRWFTGSGDALSALAENPEAVSNAQDMASAATDAGSFVKGIAQHGQAAAKTARAALSDETAVTGAVDAAQEGLAQLTGGDIDAPGLKDTLNNIVKSLGKDPSEQSVQDAIDKIREVVPQNTRDLTDAQQIVDRVDSQLSSLLKSQNAEYKAGMAESSATRGPMKQLTSDLNIKNGSLPGNYTDNGITRLSNPNAYATQRALSSTPGGTQFAANMSNSASKDALQRSLLGKLALWGVPRVNPVVQGAIQATPAVGNAVYQGLTQ